MSLPAGSLGNECLEFLVQTLPKGAKILELGSGEGTKALLEKGFKMFSIEHNTDWAFKYHEDYILSPLKLNEKTNRWWYDPKDLKGNLPNDYDLILIDGPIGSYKGLPTRLEFLVNQDLFNMNVSILVDDTNRSIELDLFNILSKDRKSSLHGRFGYIYGSIIE